MATRHLKSASVLLIVICLVNGVWSSVALGQNSTDKVYADLLQKVKTGNVFEKEDAAKALTQLKPSDISDKNLRKQIARAFKDLAYADHPTEGAITGLAVWGGK